MPDDVGALRDVFWKMYQEQCAQGRHHETQRSTVAAALIAIAGAMIGLVTFDESVSAWDVPLTGLLTAIGAFGALFSAKHYERFNLHTERARAYRDALDDLLPGKPVKKLKVAADKENDKRFPTLSRLRLNAFWTGLYLLICVIGIALTIVALVHPTPPEGGAGEQAGAPAGASQAPLRSA